MRVFLTLVAAPLSRLFAKAFLVAVPSHRNHVSEKVSYC